MVCRGTMSYIVKKREAIKSLQKEQINLQVIKSDTPYTTHIYLKQGGKSSGICSYLGHFQAQARKNKKNPPRKKYICISESGTFLSQKT